MLLYGSNRVTDSTPSRFQALLRWVKAILGRERGRAPESCPFQQGDVVIIRPFSMRGTVHSIHNGFVLVEDEASGTLELLRPDEIGLIQPVDSDIVRVHEEELARFESILFCAEVTRWAVIGILVLLLLVVVAQLGHLRGWWM